MSEQLSLNFRAVEPSDTDFLFSLYASSRAEEMQSWGWSWEQQNSFLEMQFRIQSQVYKTSYPDAVWQIISNAERSLGSWIVDWSQAQIQLIYIVIVPEDRDRGIGTQIVQGLLDQAQAMGKSVHLSVLKDNRAKNLYERLGFSEIFSDKDQLYTQMIWHPVVSFL